MSILANYLQRMSQDKRSGSAVKETSFYGFIQNLFDEIGKDLKPKVRCVINLQNRGGGIPDGGFFTPNQFQKQSHEILKGQLPERGSIEIKSTQDDVDKIAESEQVAKYLKTYRQVLVTNYRDFLLVVLDENDQKQNLESFSLAEDEKDFWQRADAPEETVKLQEARFIEFIKRVMLHAAPIAKPEDVAWFLASYARDAKARIEHSDISALATIRTALEDSLGIKFEGEKGEKFFRSTLVQTLFYGVFSAWVLWHKRHSGGMRDEGRGAGGMRDEGRGMNKTSESEADLFIPHPSSPIPFNPHPSSLIPCNWRTAVWELRVPMISVLFEQIATPSNLKQLNLVEVLDWTGNVLNRVAREEFFTRFAEDHAVQYFYEPFLQAFDPDLRKDLGVWYTPQEIVKYMVERVNTVLIDELGLPDGLADESVYVLDPACGTGAYLVEVLKRINQTLIEKGEDATRGQKIKRAVQSRIFGFEILPAPFVVSHLQVGLLLEQFGIGLSEEKRERAGVFLTNSLTGWDEHPKTKLPFPEFEEERQRADQVKKEAKILVILGNPPYNGLAGLAVEEERELSNAYRTTKRAPAPQGQGLNDLYVRFFRMAERRIAEISRQGVVCYISNYSWLEGLSHTGMRERYLEAFDKIWIDNLNGDKYKTGKLTPEGKPDPSIFSTEWNREGIQVGTAIALFVKNEKHEADTIVNYRNLWGKDKRKELESEITQQNEAVYEKVEPSLPLGLPFVSTQSNEDYFEWKLLPELFPVSFSGVNTGRDDVLVSIDRESLIKRMETYFDANISHETMKRIAPNVMKESKQFEARKIRDYLINRGFNPENIVRYIYRPFDMRWLYWEGETNLLDRKRADYFPQIFEGNFWIVAAQQNRREFNPPIAPTKLASMHIIERGTNLFPLYLAKSKETLFDAENAVVPNLSEAANDYLETVSGEAADLFFHSLAILHSTEYRAEHASALRQNFPRIPLPHNKEDLIASATLGKQIAALLDTEKQVAGVTVGKIDATLRTIGVAAHAEGKQFSDDDFAVTAGWGHAGKDGVTMPAKGKYNIREAEIKSLGNTTYDIFINNFAYWRNVPEKVWNYYIGGYQVIKKWLSYREIELLKRPLNLDEITEVTNMIRRISAIILLENDLNANYQRVKV